MSNPKDSKDPGIITPVTVLIIKECNAASQYDIINFMRKQFDVKDSHHFLFIDPNGGANYYDTSTNPKDVKHVDFTDLVNVIKYKDPNNSDGVIIVFYGFNGYQYDKLLNDVYKNNNILWSKSEKGDRAHVRCVVICETQEQ